MKRVQILLDEGLDADLERRAAAEGVSKSGLIRQLLRQRLGPQPGVEKDAVWAMAGVDDFPPEPVDDVVYR